MAQLFLVRLFKINKPLFWGVILFILGQIYFTYKGVETFPFFNYGMYSARFEHQDTLTEYRIYINQELLNKKETKSINLSFIKNNIEYYDQLKNNQFHDLNEKTINDKVQNDWLKKTLQQSIINNGNTIESFPNWLHSYLEKRTQQQINSLVVINEKHLITTQKTINDTLIKVDY